MEKIQDNSGTKSFINFAVQLDQSDMLLHFMNVGNSFITENIDNARERLKARVQIDFIKHNPEQFLDINYYGNHFSKMIYIQAIDTFITYFKEIFAEIVIKKPQILKSGESEKLDFILSFESMEELVIAISEKKIEELFYKSWKDIKLFLENKLGIMMFEDEEKENGINLIIKQRNLVVHNRSKISKEFIREFPNEDYDENQFLKFNYDYVENIISALYEIIAKIDIQLSEKYDINLIKY